MTRGRWIALVFLALVTLGSLSATIGVAWYLRSAGYRAACARVLSDALGLPSEIGRVVPLSRSAREFQDIVVWLPDKRGIAHTCERAIIQYTPTQKDPLDYEIELISGTSEVSTRTWLRSDYRDVIESGLRPGFTEFGPRRVKFSKMHLVFERDAFRADLQDAAGTIEFDDPLHGRARAICGSLNGHSAGEPVLLTAAFSPTADGIRADQLELTVPALPLSIVGLNQLAGLTVTRGTFDGKLAYSEPDGQKHVLISGHCTDLDLAELTGGRFGLAWRGRCPEIEMQELRVENRIPRILRFRGRLEDVQLGDILGTFGLADTIGKVALTVADAQITPAGIDRFVVNGECVDLDLAALSKSLGLGVMTGVLRVKIADLTIVDSRLKSADITFSVTDAGESPNWIEGRVLREIARRMLKFELPPILPERVEYSKLGFKLEVQDEDLQVFGGHGEKEATILTVRLLGRDLPLIQEPKRSFDLTPIFDSLRFRMNLAIQAALQRAATQPATAPANLSP